MFLLCLFCILFLVCLLIFLNFGMMLVLGVILIVVLNMVGDWVIFDVGLLLLNIEFVIVDIFNECVVCKWVFVFCWLFVCCEDLFVLNKDCVILWFDMKMFLLGLFVLVFVVVLELVKLIVLYIEVL